MNFINPFDLLDVAETDGAVIKKAKKRKLTEFDLSDNGMIDFENQQVTKSDFIRVTDELDSNEKTEFYLFIKNNKPLNAFLTNGNTSLFANFRQESIYSDTDFINFISPYFTAQYSKVLLNAFENDDISLLKKIVSNSLLISSRDTDKAYKGVSVLLKNVEDELHEIRAEIDNEESYYDEDTVDELENDLREKVNNDAINVLPIYFQAQRNEIAQKVRNISVAVFNTINNAEAAFQIISYSLEFNVNNLTKQKLQKDYEQLKEIYENRKESEEFSPELAKYATVLLEIVGLIKSVENNKLPTLLILPMVNRLFSVSELNQLPEVFDEIREQIAIGIRSLSVTVFNEMNEIDVSLGLIQLAQKITLKTETKIQIDKAHKELLEINQTIISNETKELNQLIDLISKIKYQALNQEKLEELLNNIFSDENLKQLSKSKNYELKKKLIYEFFTLSTSKSLSTTNARKFLTRLKTIVGITDIALLMNIDYYHDNIDNIKFQIAAIEMQEKMAQSAQQLHQIGNAINRNNRGGCYIATACYGSYEAPEVLVFRQFRDNILSKTMIGRLFIKFYYCYSPFWAEKLKCYPSINKGVKTIILNPIFNFLNK